MYLSFSVQSFKPRTCICHKHCTSEVHGQSWFTLFFLFCLFGFFFFFWSFFYFTVKLPVYIPVCICLCDYTYMCVQVDAPVCAQRPNKGAECPLSLSAESLNLGVF